MPTVIRRTVCHIFEQYFIVLHSHYIFIRFLHLISASDIGRVSLQEDANITHLTAGTVSIVYRGTPTYICRLGDQKNWGKREADTTCKQLEYPGGWPYDTEDTDTDPTRMKLFNFDCDECEFSSFDL